MQKTKAVDTIVNIRDSLGLRPEEPIPTYISDHSNLLDYFSADELQRKNVLVDNLFGDEDFIRIENIKQSRSPYNVKMGSLLFTVKPDGKGSFELKINYIDTVARILRPPLFNFIGARYPDFQMDDLVPFRFNDLMSTVMNRNKNHPLIPSAHAVRQVFMDMILNNPANPVPQARIQETIANFFAANEAYEHDIGALAATHTSSATHASSATLSTHSLFQQHQGRDIKDFEGVKFNLKPRNEKELAAKLAICFFMDLSLDEEKIKKIISEYIDETRTLLTDMDASWVNSVMSQKIDLERYTLKTVFQEDISGSTLLAVIEQIKHEQELGSGPTASSTSS